MIFIPILFGILFETSVGLTSRDGFPLVRQTLGEIWPKPQTQTGGDGTTLQLDSGNFNFELSNSTSSCDIITMAVERYKKRFFPPTTLTSELEYDEEEDTVRMVSQVAIIMTSSKGCEKYPHKDMNEQYEIKIDTDDARGQAQIIGMTAWGILRGLESFSHLIYTPRGKTGMYFVNRTQILDFPRFTHRGILLDTSRHFLTMSVLLQNLDLMEMNKMNVFHWHLVDDQSFPYQSRDFPNLSLEGSYQSVTHEYTQANVAKIVEEARLRGIRVIPEFDTPGHTQSWEPGQPGLLTVCNSSSLSKYGPMNPIDTTVYDFLQKFFQEIYQVFPDTDLHIGGDEVDTACWESNGEIKEYMLANNLTDYRQLESIFIQALFKRLDQIGNKTYIVWQEVFDNHDQMKADTIVEVWKSENWQEEVLSVTKAGFKTIVSSPWYLNYISYGSDAMTRYLEDPQDFGGTPEEESLVVGGEACMWAEYQNTLSVLSTLWPRASAVAERLWSAREVRDKVDATSRLQEQECRMMIRGYQVGVAFGAGFCNVNLAAN